MSRVDDETVQRLQKTLAAEGVHTLIAQFTDIHGVAKGKWVPFAHLDALLTDGVGFSGPSIAGDRKSVV